MLMAKLHRLHAGQLFLRYVRRPANHVERETKNDQTGQRRYDADFRESIKAAVEDLRHVDALTREHLMHQMRPEFVAPIAQVGVLRGKILGGSNLCAWFNVMWLSS